MRKPHKLGLALAAVVASALVASALVASPSFAATAECNVVDRSTDEELPGVTLTWDSSFLCANAPDSGTYEIEVTVSNAAGSAEAVEISDLRLSHTTPRPGGRGPDATAEAQGLPMVVGPGESESFRVSGRYELVSTDEGDKANLHLRALGRGVESDDPFELGINVALRGEGAVEESGEAGAMTQAARAERLDLAWRVAGERASGGLTIAQLATSGADSKEIAAAARTLGDENADAAEREDAEPDAGRASEPEAGGPPPWAGGPPPWAGSPAAAGRG
ncbi:MAG: hypothetical protein ACRDGE_00820 [Candidatus Limnocylindria bacterium]